MTQQAETLGFAFSRKGCPCNGTPVIYTITREKTLYTLTIWERRNTWRLTSRGCVLATGNKDNLTDKIKALWDL